MHRSRIIATIIWQLPYPKSALPSPTKLLKKIKHGYKTIQTKYNNPQRFGNTYLVIFMFYYIYI